jgi:hypothetical protein
LSIYFEKLEEPADCKSQHPRFGHLALDLEVKLDEPHVHTLLMRIGTL